MQRYPGLLSDLPGFRCAHPGYARCPRLWGTSRFLFDFPRRVVRDVHREIAARAGWRRHGYAGKWLTPGDPLILPGTAGDDVGATIHFRLRLVEVARIEGRENLVAVAVGQHAGAVNVFLVAGRHVQCYAMGRHLVQHLLSLHVLGSPDRLQCSGLTESGDVNAHQRLENEVRDVGRSPLLFNRLSQAAAVAMATVPRRGALLWQVSSLRRVSRICSG